MKSKSLIAALALVLPMSGCSLLFPEPPSNICEEENKPLSKEELIYRALDHFYDDPLDQVLIKVPDGIDPKAYEKRHQKLTHFSLYIEEYLKNNNSERRQVIESYYQRFPDCCLVYSPPRYTRHRNYEWRKIAVINEQDASYELKLWASDVVIFPQETSAHSLATQKQFF